MIPPSSIPSILRASDDLAEVQAGRVADESPVEPAKLCAWCNGWHQGGKRIDPPANIPTIDGFISHGICLSCYESISRELSTINTRVNLKAL